MAEAAKSNLSLMEALSLVPDPRSRLGRRHALPAVLALLSMAVMCGCRSVYAALQWGRDQGAETVARLGLGKHGVPTDGMMSNLLRRLDVGAFEAALTRWAASWPQAVGGPADGMPAVVAMDGKTLRGSRGHEVPGVHLLSAYAVKLGVVVKQIPANAADGGEIQAALALLEGLVLQGKVITGDAIHAQKELCQKIVDGDGDYLLTVKENQSALHRELVDLFRSPCDPLLATAK